MLTEKDHIFDGFCYRNFNPNRDGWMNTTPNMNHYPGVKPLLDMAADVQVLISELAEARKRIWELERELDSRDYTRNLSD